MSDDKIAEIRARHSRDDRWRNLPSMICPQAHDDRALLLAEIERLRAEIERLIRLKKLLDRNEREFLAAIGLATTTVLGPGHDPSLALSSMRLVLAKFEKLRAENERLREVLSWYADQRNHFPVERRSPGDPDPAVVFVEEPPIMSDGGKRARKALWGKP